MPFDITRNAIAFNVILNEKPVIVQLRYPEPIIIRNFFREVKPRFEVVGSDIRRVGREGKEAKDLILDHILGVNDPKGKPIASAEEAKSELRKPRAQKFINIVVNRCLFSGDVMEPIEESLSADGEEEGFDFGSLFASKPIIVECVEWDEEKSENVAVQMKFTLKEATSEQVRQYDAAKPIIQKKGRRVLMEQQENVSTIAGLFEDRILSIENAVYQGKAASDDMETTVIPCEEATRDEWASKVPYHLIAIVMDEDSGSAELGND